MYPYIYIFIYIIYIYIFEDCRARVHPGEPTNDGGGFRGLRGDSPRSSRLDLGLGGPSVGGVQEACRDPCRGDGG